LDKESAGMMWKTMVDLIPKDNKEVTLSLGAASVWAMKCSGEKLPDGVKTYMKSNLIKKCEVICFTCGKKRRKYTDALDVVWRPIVVLSVKRKDGRAINWFVKRNKKKFFFLGNPSFFLGNQ
jgi:hypothetical protein